MEEYINRKELDFLNDYCIDGGKYAGLRLDEVFDELATKDVIERSKFDKSIAEIKDNTFEHIVFEGGYDENEGVIRPKETTEVIRLDTLLEILKRNIGE